MSVSEIMNYVRKTPGNTNPAVIKSMVESENSKYVEEAANKAIRKLEESGQIGHADVVPGFSIKWDGNTEDREHGIMFLGGNPYAFLYKVSDRVFNREELVGATLVNVTGDSMVLTNTMVSTTSMIDASLTGDTVIVMSDSGFHVISSKAVVVNSGDIHIAVPSDGTYFVCTSTESHPSELTKAEIETIHPIDQKYLPQGGVGYTVKEVFTYDGQGETVEFDGFELAMVVDKAIDPYSIVKIVGIMYGNTIEVGKNDITVQKVSVDGTPEATIYVVYASYGGASFPIIHIWDMEAAGGDNATYVISDSDGDGYVSRIETEIIHPIDPKYLPKGGIGYGESHTFKWAYTENPGGIVVGGAIVKVSSLTPSIKELEGGTVSISGAVNEKVTLTAYGNSPTMMDIGGAIIATDLTMIVYGDNFVIDGVTFPEKGIYIPNMEGQTIELSYGTIHKIDQKYLPGVCLPMVELSTNIEQSQTEIQLTAEESAMINEVASSGSPFLGKVNTAEGKFMVLFTPVFFTDGTTCFTGGSFLSGAAYTFMLAKNDSGWVIIITIVIHMPASE